MRFLKNLDRIDPPPKKEKKLKLKCGSERAKNIFRGVKARR